MASYAFPKKLRLLRRREFRQVYEGGERRSAPLCTLYYLPNGLSVTRLGITTPGRLGNAVLRNRIRRRLREVFRLNRSAIPLGWDVVVNPRPAVVRVTFQNLTREFMRLLPSRPPSSEQRGEGEPGARPSGDPRR